MRAVLTAAVGEVGDDRDTPVIDRTNEESCSLLLVVLTSASSIQQPSSLTKGWEADADNSEVQLGGVLMLSCDEVLEVALEAREDDDEDLELATN